MTEEENPNYTRMHASAAVETQLDSLGIMPTDTRKYVFKVDSTRQVRAGESTTGPASFFAYYNNHTQLYVARDEKGARTLAEKDGLIVDNVVLLTVATKKESAHERLPSPEHYTRAKKLWDQLNP
jgi:hypothetical protein